MSSFVYEQVDSVDHPQHERHVETSVRSLVVDSHEPGKVSDYENQSYVEQNDKFIQVARSWLYKR